MPRINKVSQARKDQGSCRCGTEIKAGDAYQWIKFRYGGRRVKCSKCAFRPSELTQSKLSAVYAAQEGLHDFLDGWTDTDVEEPRSEATNALDEIRAVQEEYEEAAEAMGEAGESCVSRERADELESWADDLESAVDELAEIEEGEDPNEWRDNVLDTLVCFQECPL